MAAHETYDRNEEVPVTSDRVFGLVFTTLFLIVGALPLRHQLPPRWWAFVLAGAFLVASVAIPGALQTLNRGWTRFSLLLQKITNPVVMGILFYALITPMALVMKILGKDPLSLGLNSKIESYWIERKSAEPLSETMRRQF
ncbi:MAG: hypothetical protein HY074_13295 [Deltaproteobacteria bacterium]|nr:hypothetical protein [Deltaproteobacteria bacterium]